MHYRLGPKLFPEGLANQFPKRFSAIVCLGSTNNLTLLLTLHGSMVSPVDKNSPALYIVPGCIALKLRRARYVSFYPQIANTNCMRQDLYRKHWLCQIWANLFWAIHEQVLIGVASGMQTLPIYLCIQLT